MRGWPQRDVNKSLWLARIGMLGVSKSKNSHSQQHNFVSWDKRPDRADWTGQIELMRSPWNSCNCTTKHPVPERWEREREREIIPNSIVGP